MTLRVIGQLARVEVRESNRVALTAGQRTRIANSCTPRGAGSAEWRVLGRGRVKRVRSRGKDHERETERTSGQAEGEKDTDVPADRKRESARDSTGERENGDTWYSTAAVERVQCRG